MENPIRKYSVTVQGFKRPGSEVLETKRSATNGRLFYWLILSAIQAFDVNANNEQVRTSRGDTGVNVLNIFDDKANVTVFNQIAEEIAAGKYKPLASDPNKLLLTHYQFEGAWRTEPSKYPFKMYSIKDAKIVDFITTSNESKDGIHITQVQSVGIASTHKIFMHEFELSQGPEVAQAILGRKLNQLHNTLTKLGRYVIAEQERGVSASEVGTEREMAEEIVENAPAPHLEQPAVTAPPVVGAAAPQVKVA